MTVELKEYDAANYDTQMTADLSAGTAPDIYIQKNFKIFYTYWTAAQLLDVSDVAEGLRDTTSGLTDYQVDGKTYAMPYRQDSWVLYYNKDLFDKAGVAYPDGSWTWDDYAKAAKELTTGAEGGRVDGGRRPTSTRGSRPCRASRSPRRRARTWPAASSTTSSRTTTGSLDLQDAGAQPSFGTVTTDKLTYQAQFGKQKAAMMPMGTWYVATLLAQQASGDADTFNWGIAPAPQLDSSTAGTSKTPVTFGDPTGLGINPPSPTGRSSAVAKAFLGYAAGQSGAKALAGIGITPANTSDAVTADVLRAAGRADRRPVEVRLQHAQHQAGEPGLEVHGRPAEHAERHAHGGHVGQQARSTPRSPRRRSAAKNEVLNQ